MSRGGENELRALNDIGAPYQAKGDLVKVREFLNQALWIRQRIVDWPAESTALIDLGNLSLQKQELNSALGYPWRCSSIVSRWNSPETDSGGSSRV